MTVLLSQTLNESGGLEMKLMLVEMIRTHVEMTPTHVVLKLILVRVISQQ